LASLTQGLGTSAARELASRKPLVDDLAAIIDVGGFRLGLGAERDRMWNDYRLLTDAATLFEGFSETRIKIRFSEGKPNLEARKDIKITDTAPIVRAVEGEPGAGDLVQRRWSWPGQNGKPVYNFRSDGREFASGRCLIPADGFYEFTNPADKKKKRKDKWLFTKTGEPWFCIAGIWRTDKDAGEAFTMLTMPPGPDIAHYHDRPIAILHRAEWAAWLDSAVSAKTILKPLPPGALAVQQVG
jgi:putative SOS response-associated peptidase YedK